jgi:hypothetical protein
MFRHLFESEETRALVGFDVFGKFPETELMPTKSGGRFIKRRRRKYFSRSIAEGVPPKGCGTT